MLTNWLISAVVLGAALPCGAADTVGGLWRDPGAISVDDWTWGPGGRQRAPQPPFEFVEEDFGGTNPKVKVRDANGNHWVVKFGGEIHSGVFASRLLYALGYVTSPNYFVRSGVISGAHNLRRAKHFIGKDGAFAYARFKLHDKKELARVEDKDWSWNDNPFVGTHELNGLKILLMLTSNWDAKDARDGRGSNTAVLSSSAEGGQLYYAFEDWGATMGRWGGFFKRDKWNPEGYRAQTSKFVRATPNHELAWGYQGKHGRDITSGISIGDVQWLLQYLCRITDEELRAGLRASGATQAQIELYTRALCDRIGQLERVSTLAEPNAAIAHAVPR
jgi:hypothetical protein